MSSERENFQSNQKQRWYRRINWGVHKQQYREILDKVVADKAAAKYWDHLYVDTDTSDDDRWIMMRLGNHPVDMRGKKFTVEFGGSLSMNRQLDGRVVISLQPCHLEGEASEQIVFGTFNDPSHVTGSVLRRAVDDFFRLVRVTSVMLSASRRDRVRVQLLRFESKHPGREKLRWVATNWPAFVVATALSIFGLYLGHASLVTPKSSKMGPDELIRRTNPTVLRVVDAGWVVWSGDEERFLTLTIGNVSNLDALDPKACLFDGPACGRLANSHGVLAAPEGGHLAIGRDQTVRLPVLSESQVREHMKGEVRPDSSILGWGLQPEIPYDLEHSCAHPTLDALPCMNELRTVGIPIRVEWATTLDEQRSLNTAVYAFVEEPRDRAGGAD